MTIEQLRLKLTPALKHIELLCDGFSVKSIPPYKDVLEKVCKDIEEKQTQKIDAIHFIFQRAHGAVIAIEGSILKQFKEKFINIAKYEMIPEIKKFCRANPEIKIDSFRGLFEIKLEMK